MFVNRPTTYGTSAALATALINDLQAAGLTPRYVNAGSINDAAGSMTATKATFEFTPDPFLATDPWRVQVDGTGNPTIRAGTATELTDAGSSGGVFQALAGITTFSLEYALSVSPRGLGVVVTTPATTSRETGAVVIQRPLRADGSLEVVNRPVLMFGWIRTNSTTAPGAAYGLVRGSDRASGAAGALAAPEIVVTPQTGRLHDGSYWNYHPNLLTYANDVVDGELDMLGLVRWDTVNRGDVFPTTRNGQARSYTAAGNPLGSATAGLRAVLLSSGGGV